MAAGAFQIWGCRRGVGGGRSGEGGARRKEARFLCGLFVLRRRRLRDLSTLCRTAPHRPRVLSNAC
jgi:hypothetical protein